MSNTSLWLCTSTHKVRISREQDISQGLAGKNPARAWAQSAQRGGVTRRWFQ